jgi:SAM-dependent methyltransferase
MVRRRRPPTTSWDRVADRYREFSARRGPEFVVRVVYPEVMKSLGSIRGRRVLDVGCGTGAFARRLAARGAEVLGLDASPRTVEIARRDAKEAGLDPAPIFEVGEAHDPGAFPRRTFDAATLVLSLQRMEHPEKVLWNVAMALKPGGRLVLALSHPCFRITGSTYWGWDPDQQVQFRRVDRYRSSHRIEVPASPGNDAGASCTSLHLPLERLFGALRSADFHVVDLVEPVSDLVLEGGRTGAENRARQEIPLFLVLLARLCSPRPRRAPPNSGTLP